MRIVVVVATLILTACGSPTMPVTQGSPGETASSSRTATPISTPISTPSPTSGCRLPVAKLPPDSSDPARRDVGFVAYPGGGLSLASDAIVYDPGTGTFRTSSQPYLYGQDAEAYDAPAQRWVPTSYALISPDGSEYVYQAPGTLISAQSYGPSSIHVVQVVSGTDRAINSQNAYPVAFEPEGILAVISTAGYGSDQFAASDNLLLLDPATGASRQLAKSGVRWSIASDGAVFGTDLSPADPSPLIQSPMEPGPSRAPDRAWRLETSTGVPVQWLYRPGRLVEVAGVDAGGRLMVIVVGFDKTEMWALTGPESGEKVYDGPGHGQTDPLGLSGFGIAVPGIADGNGFWLSTGSGIVLYSSGVGFKLVYSGQAAPVGPCA
jgi:hypothetical protein